MCLSRVCVCVCVCVCARACVRARAQSRPILCNSLDCSLTRSSVHGIFQARILNWIAISYSRGSSWSRDRTHVSCIGRRILYHHATWETPMLRPCKQTKTNNRGGGRLKHFALVKFINHSKCSSILSSCFLWGNFCSFFRFGELLFLTEPPELRTLNCKLVLCPSCLPALSGHTWAGNVILR